MTAHTELGQVGAATGLAIAQRWGRLLAQPPLDAGIAVVMAP